MSTKRFFRTQLSYVIMYPIFWLIFTLIFEALKLSTGNILVDVAIITAFTGCVDFLFVFYIHNSKRLRRTLK